MKTLLLIRHAHALPAYEAGVPSDALRPLSEPGRQKAARTAKALAGKGLHPQIVFSSPLLRAVQTAEIIAQMFHAPLSKETVLNGLYDEKDVRDFLTEQFNTYDTIAAVGHNPNVSYLTHLLCAEVHSFMPGSFAWVDMTDPKAPRLTYFGE